LHSEDPHDPIDPIVPTLKLYNIQTPIKDSSGIYPDNQYCSYSLEDRQPGYQYSYIYLSTPQIEAQITSNSKSCYDCMEYEHTDLYGSSSTLVTCGNDVDDRLDYGAGTISNVAFTFKSDGSNGLQGTNFYLYEFLVTPPGGYYGKRSVKRGASSQVFLHVATVNSNKRKYHNFIIRKCLQGGQASLSLQAEIKVLQT